MPVKFILEVDMDGFGDEAATELGRILRYWGGAMRQVTLEAGAGSAIYDSEYREVGRWAIEADPS
jgi:hypothetical protein